MSYRHSETLNFQCYKNSFDRTPLAKYFKFDRINSKFNETGSVSTGQYTSEKKFCKLRNELNILNFSNIC
jgi:hypothetical protein